MSKAQELRDKAARALRNGRKTTGKRRGELAKVYGTVAATYKNLAHEEEKVSGRNARPETRKT